MPNHVRNVVKFKNLKPSEVDLILNMIASPIYYRKKGATEVDRVEYMIDFDKIIPEPKFESECPEDCLVNSESHIEADKDRPWFDWYKWHNEYWGTKWGAYDGYTKIGKSYITFVFSTAWSMPYPIIKQLHLLGFDMEIRYADESIGYNCGKLTYTNEQGWTHWDEDELKNPDRFARDLWNTY